MFSCVTVPLDLQVDEAGASLSLFFEIVRTAFLRTALSNAPQNASIKGSNLVLSFKLLFSLFPAIDKKSCPEGGTSVSKRKTNPQKGFWIICAESKFVALV